MELQLIIFLLSFLHGIYGQVTVPPSTVVAGGVDVLLVCRATEDNPIFIWNDVTAGQSIYVGATKASALPKYDNIWLQGSTDPQTSTLNISAIEVDDHGEYRCTTNSQTIDTPVTVVTVEVESARNVSVESTIESNIDMYVATCDALDGRPEITITWMLDDGPSPCGDPVPIIPTAGPGLFSKTSVCTFQATRENYNQILKCDISGHQLQNLNGAVTATLDTHSEPSAGILMVGFEFLDPSLRVSCVIDDANQPKPSTRNYYIYSNDSLIHQSSTEDNNVVVPAAEFDLYTEFTCVAGNYLDNVTSEATRYDPTSTTTPPPVTEHTTEGNTATMPGLPTIQPSTTTNENETGDPKTQGLPAGAIAGIAIGCIFCIVIIVVIVLYFLRPECCPCFAGSGTPPPSNKPSGRAVGSSNGSGSEKDVESPLNGVKDVTAEEKLPQAAPRGHGSIQHTNDNPDQAMYAMVDKKPARGGGGAGDAPDRGSGPGQNEPPGMLYADLDLSHKAGHTDKHVPKNENDVVVYSSILV